MKTTSAAPAARPEMLPRLLGILLVAAVYFGAARLGLLLASVHGSVSPVWPATGVAIGALLIGGFQLWPGVALGAFAANALTPVSLLVAAGIGAGNTLEAVAGAWIMGWCAAGLRRRDLDYLAEPAGFTLAAVVAPVISASCGVLILMAGNEIPSWSVTGTLWLTWWVGDALGALMVAPLLLAMRDARRARQRWTARHTGQAVVVLLATLAICWLVFFQPAGSRWLFALFLVLLLAVAWFGSVGAKLAAFLISALGIGAAFLGSGPFAGGSLNEDLLHLQLFLTSVATAALLLPVFRSTGRLLLPSVLLVAAWALGGWLFASLHRDRLQADAAHFDALVTETTNRIRQRLSTYEDSLRGGAGLFLAAKNVGRAEWRAYVEALHLPERYPGIEGLGVVLPVRPADTAAFLAARRADGVPDFVIKHVPGVSPPPAGPDGPEQFVIAFIEPLASNQAALGLDTASEPNRRTAAEEARDQGEPRITPRISLVQDIQRRPAFLLYVPIYRFGLPVDTVAQRRAALAGWVDAVFITPQFLNGVLGPGSGEIVLDFYEGDTPGREHLLYATPGSRREGTGYERSTRLELGGRMFTAAWNRGPAFLGSGPSTAIWAATSSALVSLLLVCLVVSLSSASRRAQALAAARTSDLLVSEARFRLLIENVQDYGIFALDTTGRVATWNSGAERNHGYAAGEITGRHFSVFYPPADITAGKPARMLAAAATNGRAEDEGWRVRRDGSRFWASVVITALHHPDGSLLGFVKIVRDITERKRLEESLALARDQALEASRLKSEFLATMSHEIRTPMNGIIGMSGLLLDTETTAEQRTMGRVIQSSAERLLAVIDDILDFSKIEAGRLRLIPVDFDLQQVIEETLALLAPHAHEKGLELLCDCDPSLRAALRGDAGRIQQVLTNLVGNAIKFTAQGEVMVIANQVRHQTTGLTFRVTVRDTGIGVAGEIRDRLFEPFTQGDGTDTRQFGGTGLGLAICRQLIRLMGGRIGYESTPGHGAAFWFELQLPAGPAEISHETLAALPPGLRVLVVDDNASNRWILLAQLAHFGLEAKAVADGSAALAWLWAQAAVKEPCHLVLLDWQMPGMSGLQLAAEIRADPSLRQIPLVMLSSAGPLDDPAASAAVGFAAFLVKPVREVQLHRCLARILSPPPVTTPQPVAQVNVMSAPAAGRLRLLFAEDNPENQTVMKMVFEKMGYAVTLAANGREAIAELARQPFDAVIMDCVMPELDGYEATRRIRSGLEPGVNPRVTIIALTAHALPGEKQKCLSAGMDDYLTKPVRLNAVREVFLRCGLIRSGPRTVEL